MPPKRTTPSWGQISTWKPLRVSALNDLGAFVTDHLIYQIWGAIFYDRSHTRETGFSYQNTHTWLSIRFYLS